MEKIGNLLVKSGMISQDQLTRALREQAKNPGERLGHTLVRLGYIGRREMIMFLNEQKVKKQRKKSWIEKLFGK
ncbi:MAG: hypothetical protein AB1397_08525 [bacterium]